MITKLLIPILAIILTQPFHPTLLASDCRLNHDPQSYVYQKLNRNDIVFLGTRHQQQPILKFIADLIPKLDDSGVTHIGLEIESDQQSKIDYYLKTGKGLSDIRIHFQIDCPEYRKIFRVLKI